MGIIIRQSIKSTIVSYVGILIGVFNTLWLLPKFFLPEEIGLIRLMQDIPTLLAVFLQLGAANITDKFFIYFKDKEHKDKGFFMLLILYPLIGFSIFAVLFFLFNDFWKGVFGAKSNLLTDYFIYILPLAFFMMYMSVLEAYSRVNLRIVVPAIIREILIRSMLSVITILYALKIINFESLMILFTAIYGISLLFFIWHIKKLGKLHFKIYFSFLTPPLLKEIGKYVLFIIPGTAGSLIASKIDTLMLGSMSGLSYVGIYSLAYFIGVIVEIPKRAISQISIPFISQATKTNDLSKIEELYKKSALNQLILGCFLFLLIWCNVDDILNIIPRSEIYKEGKYVILFVGLSRLFDMATGINGEIILYSKYYKFNLISIMFLAVITIITNLIFIPIYNINGAALGFAVTIFLHNILKSVFIWYKFKIHPFTKNFFMVCIFSLFFILFYFIPFQANHSVFQSIGYIGVKSLIITALFWAVLLKYNVSKEFNSLLTTLNSGIRRFIGK